MPRKRKAFELGGEGKQAKGKKRSKAASTQQPDTEMRGYKAYPIASADVESKTERGIYVEHVVLAKGFEWDIAVESARQSIPWVKLRRYRNVKLTDSVFSTGDVIYVCNNDKMPDPPPEDAPDSKHLKFEQENYWVAKIIEARAENDKEVWLLVAWLYWPQELPNQSSRQYHGRGETVLSNSFDVIDAMTISSKADDLSFYDEWDDDKVGQASTRYWRQKFDVRSPNRNDNLGKLRTFCRCQRPHHPDTKMFHCADPNCKAWLHEECLADEIGRKALESDGQDQTDKSEEENKLKPQEPLAKTLFHPVQAVGHFLAGSVEAKFEDGMEAVRHETTTGLYPVKTNGPTLDHNRVLKTTSKKQGRPTKNTTAWKDRFKIRVVSEDGKPLYARIEEKSSPNKIREVKVDCLCCGKTLG